MALKNGKLKNPRHEQFAELVAGNIDPRQAHEMVGLKPNRANHLRLLRRPDVAARIEELRRARQDAARPAMVPIDLILSEFSRCGVDQFADLFDRNGAGILSVRDLHAVPVEVSLALVRLLCEGLGVKMPTLT